MQLPDRISGRQTVNMIGIYLLDAEFLAASFEIAISKGWELRSCWGTSVITKILEWISLNTWRNSERKKQRLQEATHVRLGRRLRLKERPFLPVLAAEQPHILAR